MHGSPLVLSRGVVNPGSDADGILCCSRDGTGELVRLRGSVPRWSVLLRGCGAGLPSGSVRRRGSPDVARLQRDVPGRILLPCGICVGECVPLCVHSRLVLSCGAWLSLAYLTLFVAIA